MTLRTSPSTTCLPRRPVALHSWEPPLAEMLADPVVQAVMTVDGVRPTEIMTLMREARERLVPISGDS